MTTPSNPFPDAPSATLRALTALAAELPGTVTLPGDAEWDTARAAWNLAIDQRPAAVAVPRDVEEISTIIRFAGEYGLRVTVQASGHGASNSMEGCILIRLNAFTDIEVDTGSRTVRVGAGARWGEVLNAIDGTGLVALAGSNPSVGVCGYLLGGGHSWFTRRHGTAAHSIRSVELVDATGTLRQFSAETDAELLWAIRGAGGDLGVITALEVELFEATELFGGKLLFDGEHARRLLTIAAEVSAGYRPSFSLSAGVLRMPPIEQVPEPLRGRVVAYVDAVFIGSAAEGAALIAPFRTIDTPLVDTMGPFTIGALSEVSAEPVVPAAGRGWSGFAPAASAELIDGMIEVVGPTGGAGATFAQLRTLGGALRGQDWSGGIAGGVDEGFLVYALWPGGDEAGPIDANPISRHANDRTFGTFLGAGETLERAYQQDALERLAAVKAAIDPDGLFVGNRSALTVWQA